MVKFSLFAHLVNKKVNDIYCGIYFLLAFGIPNMQITALRLLCCLLPIPNRDTLKVLLEFLAEVAQCAADTIDDKGNEVSLQIRIFVFFTSRVIKVNLSNLNSILRLFEMYKISLT